LLDEQILAWNVALAVSAFPGKGDESRHGVFPLASLPAASAAKGFAAMNPIFATIARGPLHHG